MGSEWFKGLSEALGFDINEDDSAYAGSQYLGGDAATGSALGPESPAFDLSAAERRTGNDHPPSASTSSIRHSPYARGCEPVALLDDPDHESGITRQHIWTQVSEVTSTKALANVVLEASDEGVRTFFCGWDDCQHPIGFSQKTQLITHIRSVHLQEKPFKCSTCGTSFARKQEAIRHVNSMNGGKRYKCSNCQKTYVRKHSRDVHEERCMSGNQGPSSLLPSSEDVEDVEDVED